MNTFQLCNERAEEQKRTHHQRRQAQARAHYEQHPDCREGVDVEERCGRDWWQDAALWPDDMQTEEITRLGKFDNWLGYAPVYQELVRRPTERDCVGRMRRQCDRADLLDGVGYDAPVVFVTLWTELVAEVQAEAMAA